MPRSSKKNEKAIEREKLRAPQEITITLRASESTMQRITALLMYADWAAEPKLNYEKVPLPWEDPNDPRFQQMPELEINYEAVRLEIANRLSRFLQEHGEEKTRELLRSFGAEKIRDVPEPQLKGLLDALAAHEAADA